RGHRLRGVDLANRGRIEMREAARREVGVSPRLVAGIDRIHFDANVVLRRGRADAVGAGARSAVGRLDAGERPTDFAGAVDADLADLARRGGGPTAADPVGAAVGRFGRADAGKRRIGPAIDASAAVAQTAGPRASGALPLAVA